MFRPQCALQFIAPSVVRVRGLGKDNDSEPDGERSVGIRTEHDLAVLQARETPDDLVAATM